MIHLAQSAFHQPGEEGRVGDRQRDDGSGQPRPEEGYGDYDPDNIFARIPVLGLFLGGSPDEGVIGITYQISGQVSAPRLTVNPLSAVTPGFLRKMFEFRGRSTVPPGEVTGSSATNR